MAAYAITKVVEQIITIRQIISRLRIIGTQEFSQAQSSMSVAADTKHLEGFC